MNKTAKLVIHSFRGKMPQVSKAKISEKMWSLIWSRLVTLINDTSDVTATELLLQGLLTKTEQIMLAKRITVFALLLSEWPVRAISRRLKIGTPTIYKLQTVLEKDIHYRKVLTRVFSNKIPYTRLMKDESENVFLTLFKTVWLAKFDRSKLPR